MDFRPISAFRLLPSAFPGLTKSAEPFFQPVGVRAMPVTENPADVLRAALRSRVRHTEPCSIVIFGASGDLTVAQTIPALYHLFKENQHSAARFPRHRFRAPRKDPDDSWRQELRTALDPILAHQTRG